MKLFIASAKPGSVEPLSHALLASLCSSPLSAFRRKFPRLNCRLLVSTLCVLLVLPALSPTPFPVFSPLFLSEVRPPVCSWIRALTQVQRGRVDDRVRVMQRLVSRSLRRRGRAAGRHFGGLELPSVPPAPATLSPAGVQFDSGGTCSVRKLRATSGCRAVRTATRFCQSWRRMSVMLKLHVLPVAPC